MARVTIVNDDPAFLELMDELIELLGHEGSVLSAESASLDSIAGTSPDVLMLDLHLKGDALEGWAFVTAARAHPALAQVPLVLSTGDHVFLREREEELASMDDVHVLSKPFTIDQVEELVRRLAPGAPN